MKLLVGLRVGVDSPDALVLLMKHSPQYWHLQSVLRITTIEKVFILFSCKLLLTTDTVSLTSTSGGQARFMMLGS